MCLRCLLAGSVSSDQVVQGGRVEDESSPEIGPSSNALLNLLRALLDGEAAWRREDAEQFFFEYVAKPSNAEDLADEGLLKVLPSVLSILMPVLRNSVLETPDGESSQKEGRSLKHSVCSWLNKALSFPPLIDFEKESMELKGKQWLEVAIACFPLQLPGLNSAIAAASSAKVSLQETSLLLRLLRKQILMTQDAEPQLLSAETTDVIELTLAKLVAVSVAYCWQDFSVEEWAFILKSLRKWLDSAVVEYEEMTEIVVSFYKDGQKGDLGLQQLSGRKILIELAATAVSVLILLKDLNKLETVTALRALGTLRASNWEAVEDHMMEAILRILMATGLSEAASIEMNADGDAANVISKCRMAESSLWESLATVALGTSTRSREAAVRAADLWGVGKGSISALYALLLSPNSSGALQWVAFQFLSTEPIQQLAVTWGATGVSQNQDVEEGAQQEAVQEETSLAVAAKLRPELAKLLETPVKLLLQSTFTSALRVNYLLGWSLLLMRLHALPPLSPTRERLLQFAGDSDISSTLLDCLFQHIPLDLTSGTSASRRRAAAAGAKLSAAATSATRSVSSGNVSFAVESLWPVKDENIVLLGGAIYGLLLRVLPACVRIWFTGLRDRSTASAIENFTSSNCSTHLLADEFSQLQASVVADDTLSIRANRTLREVTAVYKKEEACLDIVIRLPSCYPLRAVEVDCTRRLGISETLLRKWILSMASFLRNQNGALLEAIQMWKKNVDREFEGVEECPICYSIIHTTNHSLPRMACKTCKHKFHSACLYKWFSTSHKSTCPLCQTPF